MSVGLRKVRRRPRSIVRATAFLICINSCLHHFASIGHEMGAGVGRHASDWLPRSRDCFFLLNEPNAPLIGWRAQVGFPLIIDTRAIRSRFGEGASDWLPRSRGRFALWWLCQVVMSRYRVSSFVGRTDRNRPT